jgi:hypothetical protein
MKNSLGALLVGIGTIWVSISSCGLGIVFILFWIGALISMYSWAGIFGVILWLFLGTTVLGFVFSIASVPFALLGAGIITLGEELRKPGR